MDPFSGVAEIKKGEGVFLWMEIRAGERALTMLEAKGQMSIYHAWASEKWVTDIIDIGITKERWLELREAIRGEVKQKGCLGERIPVVNLDSNKVIQARVVDTQTVKIDF